MICFLLATAATSLIFLPNVREILAIQTKQFECSQELSVICCISLVKVPWQASEVCSQTILDTVIQ